MTAIGIALIVVSFWGDTDAKEYCIALALCGTALIIAGQMT